MTDMKAGCVPAPVMREGELTIISHTQKTFVTRDTFSYNVDSIRRIKNFAKTHCLG